MATLIHKGKEGFFFGTVYRIAFEIFLDVFFASVYTLYDNNWSTGIDLYANSLSLIWIGLLSTSWIFVLIYYWSVSSVSLHKFSKSNFKILFEDFKANRIWILYSFVFFLQRFILIMILIYGLNHGLIQAFTYFLVWIGVLIFKILLRPYQQTILNVQEVTFELILWVIIGIFITFKDPKSHFADSGRHHTLGIICLALILSFVILNYIFSAMLSWKNWRTQKKIRRIKSLNSKKETDSTDKSIKGSLY